MPQLSAAAVEVRRNAATLQEMPAARAGMPGLWVSMAVGGGRGESGQDGGHDLPCAVLSTATPPVLSRSWACRPSGAGCDAHVEEVPGVL